MKAILIKLSQSTMFWNILNGFISLITTELSGLPYEFIPIILAILSLVTKLLNAKYNPYYKKV